MTHELEEQQPSNLATKQSAHVPSKDNNDAWSQLHQSILESITERDYDAAIDSSRQALKQLSNHIAMFLDTCAHAYAMKGMFRDAMVAARKVITYTPTRAGGYLLVGYILTLQGKHKHAIEIYDEGIIKVRTKDELYANLIQCKMASKEQLDRRVDFISWLPIDVAQIIISYLDFATDDVVACMHVSKRWREIVVDCPLAWNSTPLDSARAPFAPMFGKHVRELHLFNCTRPRQFVEPVLNGHFCNVRLLDTKGLSIGPKLLLLVLTKLATSLRELKLVLEKDAQQDTTLESVLLACPRLDRLAYHVFESRLTFSESDTPALITYNVKSLDLKAYRISDDAVDSVLRRCPNLQELYLSKCISTSALQSVNAHCPQIKAVVLNSFFSRVQWISPNYPPGLQLMKVRSIRLLEPEHIIPILEKSQPTLKALVITLWDHRPYVTRRWRGLASIRAKNLKELEYSGSLMDMHTIVAAMIRNCRALTFVSLRNLEKQSGSVIEDALLTLPNLRTLKLTDIQEINIASLQNFLATHADRRKESSLRSVYFKRCSKISGSILQTLTTLKALEEIHIQECTDLTTSVLITFATQLSMCATLQSLVFKKLDMLTNEVLHALSRMTSLRKLTLSKLNNISNYHLKDLIITLKNLQSAKVTCPHITDDTIRDIKKIISKRKEK